MIEPASKPAVMMKFCVLAVEVREWEGSRVYIFRTYRLSRLSDVMTLYSTTWYALTASWYRLDSRSSAVKYCRVQANQRSDR